MQGCTETFVKRLGNIFPCYMRNKSIQWRRFLSIERKCLLAGFLCWVAEQCKELGGAISQWEGSLLQQSVILPDLGATYQLEAITGKISLGRGGEAGSGGVLAHTLIAQLGLHAKILQSRNQPLGKVSIGGDYSRWNPFTLADDDAVCEFVAVIDRSPTGGTAHEGHIPLLA